MSVIRNYFLVLFVYICVTYVIEFTVDTGTWLYDSHLPDLALQIVPVNAMIFNCIFTLCFFLISWIHVDIIDLSSSFTWHNGTIYENCWLEIHVHHWKWYLHSPYLKYILLEDYMHLFIRYTIQVFCCKILYNFVSATIVCCCEILVFVLCANTL